MVLRWFIRLAEIIQQEVNRVEAEQARKQIKEEVRRIEKTREPRKGVIKRKGQKRVKKQV